MKGMDIFCSTPASTAVCSSMVNHRSIRRSHSSKPYAPLINLLLTGYRSLIVSRHWFPADQSAKSRHVSSNESLALIKSSSTTKSPQQVVVLRVSIHCKGCEGKVRKHISKMEVEDFVLHDLYQLAAFAEQQPTSERLKEGITQVLNIIDNLHQPWLNGLELLEDSLQNKHVLSTGFEGVDLLLQGGLREGQLTELVGPSSSGKTQRIVLALRLVSHCLERWLRLDIGEIICLQNHALMGQKLFKNMGYVAYLDTGNSFSPQRIAHFVGQISESAFNQTKQKIIQKAMSSILCHSVFDIFSMFDVLRQLEFDLRSQMDRGEYRVPLLIVDSISSLISPVLGGSGSQGIDP
ncbi:hypothetical protein Patl1_30842 [Pistacia atlantica]|uniref:Uncharacterized protein n=1 Tax=Pistacia atlantica TaxID=434234 RepID=A0ACC1ABN3_9ROSI|nr:hypothetical protein Patl1_30842 [Pistacia atlantica]